MNLKNSAGSFRSGQDPETGGWRMRARDLCSSSDGSADLGKLRLFFFSSRLGFAKTLWLVCWSWRIIW